MWWFTTIIQLTITIKYYLNGVSAMALVICKINWARSSALSINRWLQFAMIWSSISSSSIAFLKNKKTKPLFRETLNIFVILTLSGWLAQELGQSDWLAQEICYRYSAVPTAWVRNPQLHVCSAPLVQYFNLWSEPNGGCNFIFKHIIPKLKITFFGWLGLYNTLINCFQMYI